MQSNLTRTVRAAAVVAITAATTAATTAAMTAAVTVAIAVSTAAATYADDGAAADYVAPRTADGSPDLQGIWTNQTITTLERPEYLDSLVLSPEEARRLEQTRAEFYENYDKPTETADEALPAGQDPGGYNTFWMDEGTQLAVVDGQIRSSLIVSPESGQVPYTLWGRARMVGRLLTLFASFDGPEMRPLGERCVVGFGSTGGPPMLPVLYNNHYQIVQSPGHVMILVEMNHDARIIRIGGEHPPSHVTQWLGDSVGRWDGDTLVVETTNFHPDQSLRAATKHILFTTEQLKVTERFTRVGPDEIRYGFEMHDPSIYTADWRGEMPLRRALGPIYEYACHEGNYAMPGILAGARADEDKGKGQSFVQRLARWING